MIKRLVYVTSAIPTKPHGRDLIAALRAANCRVFSPGEHIDVATKDGSVIVQPPPEQDAALCLAALKHDNHVLEYADIHSALAIAECFILVLPPSPDCNVEFGFACGRGVASCVYAPPDASYYPISAHLAAHKFTTSLDETVAWATQPRGLFPTSLGFQYYRDTPEYKEFCEQDEHDSILSRARDMYKLC